MIKILIVGDILHSRVARSNVLLLTKLGAEVVLVAPPTLLPVGVSDWAVTVSYDLDSEIEKCDVKILVFLLALQFILRS